MNVEQDFVDYYAVLQVSPGCDAKILESAYRYLAKMYHPDHPETADVDRFNAVIEAYRVLRDPARRAEYDAAHFGAGEDDAFPFPDDGEGELGEDAAVSDAEIHNRILFHLYKRRRERALDPGLAGFYLMEMLACAEEHFDFHVWYLKSKRFIETTEQGTLAITIEGVDHVISTSRNLMRDRLLMDRTGEGRN